MGTTTSRGNTGYAAKLAAMISGLQLQGVLPTGFTMWLDGKSYSVSAVVTELQTSLGLFQAVDDARAATKQAESAREAGQTTSKPFYEQVVEALLAVLGASNAQLVKFGVKPRKTPVPRTTEQRLQSTTRAKETRTLRGTKGPKAKLAVKSTAVPTVTVNTGAEAAASSTPTASPAAAPAPSSSTPAPTGSSSAS